MASATFDFVIVGGGICGVAAAYELAGHGSVALIEQESQLSYHTTGRSAAISMSSYGNATIQRLTTWSTDAYKRRTPPFANEPVWSPRGAVILSDAVNRSNLQRRIDAVRKLVPNVETLGERGILELAPYLRPGRWVAALYEPDAFDLDVHAIHSSYVKGLKHRRGAIFRNSELVSALRQYGGWDITLADGGRLGAGVLVNAAGAWADQVAARAGVAPSSDRCVAGVVHVGEGFDVRQINRRHQDLGLVGAGFRQQGVDLAEDFLGLLRHRGAGLGFGHLSRQEHNVAAHDALAHALARMQSLQAHGKSPLSICARDRPRRAAAQAWRQPGAPRWRPVSPIGSL